MPSDALEDFCAAIQSLVLELDRVVLKLATSLNGGLDYRKRLSCENALVDHTLPTHQHHVAGQGAVLGDYHEVAGHELIRLDNLLFVLSDHYNEALVASNIPQLLVIPNVFSYLHENAEKCYNCDHDCIAVKIFFDKQANTEVLEYVERGQNFINQNCVKWFAGHVYQTLAKKVLFGRDLAV